MGTLSRGEVLDEVYEVQRKIGEGQFAEVYEVIDRSHKDIKVKRYYLMRISQLSWA